MRSGTMILNVGDKLSLDQVVAAFIGYRDGSTDWQREFEFERIRW